MTPPQLTEVEALELLAQQYGLTGQLRPAWGTGS